MSASPFLTPLRYPGGKGKFAQYVSEIIETNDLFDGEYFEPYAGGAAVALHLLLNDYVKRIYINDASRSIYAFWHSALNKTSELISRITSCEVTLEEWRKQREVQMRRSRASLIDLGFSTFFLNRTNRSGILSAGVIGGQNQDGKWLIDARFNKKELCDRIERVALHADRISISQKDGADFLKQSRSLLTSRSLLYLDPPYYVKGRELYDDFFEAGDHERLAKLLRRSFKNFRWLVSYDDVDEVRSLYEGFRSRAFGLSYTAGDRYRGREVVFFSDPLTVPALAKVGKFRH